MEIWQILIICLLMLPVFYLVNYLIVKRLVVQKKKREDLIERAVAISVARRMANRKDKYGSKPRFGARQKR